MQNLDGIYEINLTHCPDSEELVNNVVNALENSGRRDSGVKLKLGGAQMNQSQMIFIKSLIESYGFYLAVVETANGATKDICNEMGIEAIECELEVQEAPKEENVQETETSNEPQEENQEDKESQTLARLNELREQFKSKYEASLRAENNKTEEEKEQEMERERELEREREIEKEKEQEMERERELEREREREIEREKAKERERERQVQEAKTASERLEERMKLLEQMKRNKEEEPKKEEVQKQTIGVYRKADEAENKLEFQDDDIDFYATPTDAPVVIDTKKTIYVTQTLRSGQVLEYDGNIVIIGDCHPGSEIKATGDITVWGVLSSIAHAGAKGNTEAKVRALKLNAVQLRIANCYSRRPDCGNVPYVVKSAIFMPEEARIVDDNIVLFKLAQN